MVVDGIYGRLGRGKREEGKEPVMSKHQIQPGGG